jgi:sulfopyruvate decarboxylase subunit beta
MTPEKYWKEVSKKPKIDFPVYGVMGKASSVGLGLSLAKPNHKILVLDGDGGLLMNLGSLVTISNADPKNFIHIVLMMGYITPLDLNQFLVKINMILKV